MSVSPAPRSVFVSARALLLALLALFAVTPFLQAGPFGQLVEVLLVTGVLLCALRVVGAQRTFHLGAGMALLALLARWAHFLSPAHVPKEIYLVIASLFFALVVVRILQHLLAAREVDLDMLCACLSGFLLLGLLWSLLYAIIGTADPRAFGFADPTQTMDGFNSFYFSFVTLSTIGYGDITPVSRLARMMAVMEAICGMFYVAVLVARLVSIHSSQTPAKKED